ncbi:hypothetical protein XHC_4403 [Xanthomonas hortorum pv. carotae str. M081]|nr:hypothetical protein XHC_4403 [Xanthomonas hortorum pv. carotae str. M081]
MQQASPIIVLEQTPVAYVDALHPSHPDAPRLPGIAGSTPMLQPSHNSGKQRVLE